MLADDFKRRVLPPIDAVTPKPEVFGSRRRTCRRVGIIDLMLPAIVHMRNDSVVAANVTDFERISLTIINPGGDQ